jgi:hypothetical protein
MSEPAATAATRTSGVAGNRVSGRVPAILAAWVATLCAVAAGGGCAPYEWQRGPLRVYAAERGRTVELVEVSVRRTKSPFHPWGTCLLELEPCGTFPRPTTGVDMPCWPANKSRVSDALLATINWHTEGYRDPKPLLSAGKDLNRHIGAEHDAYVVGTLPLAVAFLDERPDVEAYRSPQAPEPTPGPGRKGGDMWSGGRRTHLVTRADLGRTANVVLLFPDEMRVRSDYGLAPDPATYPMRARILVLPEPATLSRLIEALGGPDVAGSLRAVRDIALPVRR